MATSVSVSGNVYKGLTNFQCGLVHFSYSSFYSILQKLIMWLPTTHFPSIVSYNLNMVNTEDALDIKPVYSGKEAKNSINNE